MPGAESLVRSLRMPCFDNAFSASPISVSCAISKESLRQPTLDPRRSSTARWHEIARKVHPVLVPGCDNQPDNIRIVSGQPVQVFCLKNGVPNSASL